MKGLTYAIPPIDQCFVLEHGISLDVAAILSYLKQETGSNWQETYTDSDGVVWYWMASSKLEQQLPCVCTSRRTTERQWQRLRDAGLIRTLTVKEKNKHYYRFAQSSNDWNKTRVPTEVAEGTAKCGGRGTDRSGGGVPPNVAGNKDINDKDINNNKKHEFEEKAEKREQQKTALKSDPVTTLIDFKAKRWSDAGGKSSSDESISKQWSDIVKLFPDIKVDDVITKIGNRIDSGSYSKFNATWFAQAMADCARAIQDDKPQSTEKPCSQCGCNTDGKFSDHEGKCFECANGIPK